MRVRNSCFRMVGNRRFASLLFLSCFYYGDRSLSTIPICFLAMNVYVVFSGCSIVRINIVSLVLLDLFLIAIIKNSCLRPATSECRMGRTLFSLRLMSVH